MRFKKIIAIAVGASVMLAVSLGYAADQKNHRLAKGMFVHSKVPDSANEVKDNDIKRAVLAEWTGRLGVAVAAKDPIEKVYLYKTPKSNKNTIIVKTQSNKVVDFSPAATTEIMKKVNFKENSKAVKE